MKILHVNTYDTGGAAIAIRRIHEGLLKQGVDSKLLLLYKTQNIPQSYSFRDTLPKVELPKTNLFKRIGRRTRNEIEKFIQSIFYKQRNERLKKQKESLKEIISKVEMFTYPYSGYDITEHPLYKEADIIQLNWVSGFLDEPSFFKKNKKPVVWRMPDLYTCGGGYHYEMNFLFEELKNEILNNCKIREEALQNASIVFVPISNWLKQKAEESSLIQKFEKHVIHNGVDLSVFKPMDKKEARVLFNLPLNKKILLFGADNLKNKRKGFDFLLRALRLISITDVVFCAFGRNDDFQDLNIINVGHISEVRLLCMLYSAADLFIMPSIEEAFGQVTIEALACGTPVVSFPSGGSLDIIKNGFNGFMAKDFTEKSLADSIRIALNFVFDKQRIRKDIEDRFNIKNKADNYIDLYKKILNQESSHKDKNIHIE